MSEKVRIDYGQSGPDDGGYENITEEGTSEGFDAVMSSVTNESMGEIPSSHIDEDESIKSDDVAEPKNVPDQNKIDLSGELVDENPEATTEEIYELDDIAEKTPNSLPAQLKERATEIAKAQSFEDLRRKDEDIDYWVQITEDVKEYDEALGKELYRHLENLYNSVEA